MTSTTRVLQTADDDPLDLDKIVAALSRRFVVTTGPKQPIRRIRLDTFDRRLSTAGFTLEHQILASGEQLVLDGFGGSSYVAVPLSAPRWPARTEALPGGPIRQAVAPVAGIRALMVVSDEKRRIQRLELHNSDEKTVARVELDEPVGGATTPARLSVLALRGYDNEAARATRLLTTLGLRPADKSDGAVANADDAERNTVANRAPQRPKGSRSSDRDSPATSVVASSLSDFLVAMRENVPGLLADVDTEFLHDFRVAVRRSRATLKLARPSLPEIMRSRWEPAFKDLGDLTTPVRDLDVYVLDLPTMKQWLVAADPRDLEPLARHLGRRRAVERWPLVRRLRSAGFARLLDDWEDELAALAQATDDTGPGPGPAPAPGPGLDNDVLTAGQLADRSISRAYQRVVRDGAAISGDSPAFDLHSLRKRCKELRYALEVFAAVANVPGKRAVNDLKDLQDVLGRFQDCEVQRQALREFAEEMVADGSPTSAVLAMGELIGHLDAEQDRARHEFSAAFAHFARPENQQTMQRLGGR